MRLLPVFWLFLWPLVLQAQPSLTPLPPRVQVDARIELIGIIQLLADSPLATALDFPYKQSARSYFSSFSEHQAVTLFAEMRAEGFDFDVISTAMLAVTAPPQIAQRLPFPDYVVERAGGDIRLKLFFRALQQFIDASDFMHFFEEHKPLYREVEAKLQPEADEAFVRLQAYTGLPAQRGKIIAGMLYHDGGVTAQFGYQGIREAYAILGPQGYTNGALDFGRSEFIQDMAIHEFSHVIINPLTDRYATQLEAIAWLNEPIQQLFPETAYTHWITAVNEHIIRAITVRMTYLHHGTRAGDEMLATEAGNGFIYLPSLVNRLADYESGRDRYFTLTDFYPALIEVFEAAGTSQDP